LCSNFALISVRLQNKARVSHYTRPALGDLMLLRLLLLSSFIISLLTNSSFAFQSGSAGSRSERAEEDQESRAIPSSPAKVNHNDVVPRFVKFSGVLKDSEGKPYTGVVGVRFSLYDSEDSVSPLWIESQNIIADVAGHYNVLLGSSSAEGLPSSLFVSGEARWLAVYLQQSGEQQQSRTLLVSVPYALKAADAETLGGKPASAYALAPVTTSDGATISENSRLNVRNSAQAQREVSGAGDTGTTNQLAKFSTTGPNGTLVDSIVTESGGNIGVGTTTPGHKLDVIVPSGNSGVVTVADFASADGGAAIGNGQAITFKGVHGKISTFAEGGGITSLRLSSLAAGNVNTVMTLNGAGKVGIGSTAPAHILDVVSPSGASGVVTVADFSNPDSGAAVGNGQAITFNNVHAKISTFAEGGGITSLRLGAFQGGNTNTVVTVNGAGLVGIGTTQPSHPLDVVFPAGHSGVITVADFANLNSGAAVGNGQAITFNNLHGKISTFAEGAGVTSLRFGALASGQVNTVMTLNGSGKVGIGTSNPSATLDVNGNLHVASGGVVFPDNTIQTTAANGTGVATFSAGNSTQVVSVTQNGAGVGSFSIGVPPPSAVHGDVTATSGFISGVFGSTSSPDGFGVLGENLASGQGTGHSAGVRGITANTTAAGTGVWGDALQLTGDNAGVFGHSASIAGTGVQGLADASSGDATGVYGESDSNSGTGVWGESKATTAASTSSYPVGVYGRIASNVGAAGLFDTISTGDIMIGRSGANPVKVFRVSSTGAVFGNGAFNTSGADFAESVAVAENRSTYEPGDVLAIDSTGTRRFTVTQKPYSTLVAGIYSTKPGVLASPHPMDDPRILHEEVPLAVVGIVPCKVTNENGIITAGDLLVSSSTAGYAMKGTDRARLTGAVIGKALQSMSSSNGIIEVLVSLQ
jgi:hypothetical protein